MTNPLQERARISAQRMEAVAHNQPAIENEDVEATTSRETPKERKRVKTVKFAEEEIGKSEEKNAEEQKPVSLL